MRQIKSRRVRWAGHVTCMGQDRKVCKVLVGKPEGKSPLERARRRWEDWIKMALTETGFKGMEWIRLAQDRDWWQALVNTLINLQILAPWS
jgi:hypothetical protein